MRIPHSPYAIRIDNRKLLFEFIAHKNIQEIVLKSKCYYLNIKQRRNKQKLTDVVETLMIFKQNCLRSSYSTLSLNANGMTEV